MISLLKCHQGAVLSHEEILPMQWISCQEQKRLLIFPRWTGRLLEGHEHSAHDFSWLESISTSLMKRMMQWWRTHHAMRQTSELCGQGETVKPSLFVLPLVSPYWVWTELSFVFSNSSQTWNSIYSICIWVTSFSGSGDTKTIHRWDEK